MLFVEMATIGQNIQRVRTAAGFETQAQFARELGVPQAQLNDWESDRYKTLDMSTLLRLAKTLGCLVDDLLMGVDEAYDTIVEQQKASRPPRFDSDVEDELVDVSGYTTNDIPVVAEGEANPQGSLFWIDDGVLKNDVEERISRPREVTDTKAYGVRVRGDSMLPVFKPGMTLIVSPNLPVSDGDEVYVQLLTGERLIKIARRVPGGWLLESTNPAYEPRLVKKSEIKAMHPVIYARRRPSPFTNGESKKST